MRTQFVPGAGSWSFAPETPPVAWALPVNAKEGAIDLIAVTTACGPVDGDGVIFQVDLDGAPYYTSACMENGTDTVVIPANTLTIDVTITRGCNGGPDTTVATVAGAGA